MAINKKLLHFVTKANFSTQLANSNIDSKSIVFIKDTGEIWTHDKLYSCASWGTNQTNYVPLTIGGTSYNISKDGHTHSYLPLLGGQLTGQLGLLQGAGGGISFPDNSFGGGGDSASIKLLNPAGGESTEMTFTMANDADDIINFSVPSIDGVKINRYTVWNAGNFTNLNQLTTRNFSDLQNIPTTLSGYGITDALLKSDINIQVGGTKNSQMSWASWNNSDVYGGAIQLREYGYVSSTQSDWYYAPAITFHWGNRAARRFGMRYDGQFAIDDNPILWSGNYSSYALPLSGGTITGSVSVAGSITNLSNNGGGIFWNPYAESVSDGSDAASISVATSGGSTVMSIKQMNDANDYINFLVGASDGVRVNGSTIYHAGNFTPSSYLLRSGDSMTGLLTTTSSSPHSGIRLGNLYLTAINEELIVQNTSAIRFGADEWDYNVWAGLKFNNTNKTIYLGLGDGSIFSTNSTQSGYINLTPGVAAVYLPATTYFSRGSSYYVNSTGDAVLNNGNFGGNLGLGGQFTSSGAIISNSAALGASTPFAITNSRIQSYTSVWICADTDNSTGEGVFISASKGVSTNPNDGLAIYNNTVNFLGNSVWHSGNFNPSNYLPLSGGTLTGSVFLPLDLPALRFGNARVWDSAIAHDTASYEVEAFMTKSIGSKYRFKVGFDPVTFANGTFVNMTNADLEIGAGYCKINNNTVWHAGNDGAGSGLDADLLDGYQSTDYDHDYYIGYHPDYRNVVILLFDINTITIHRINGRFYSTRVGGGRYISTDVDIWYSRWTTTGFDRSINVFNKSNLGSLDLVTCVYNGKTYLALKFDDNDQAKAWSFNGTGSESFTIVEYYNRQNSTVINSEIYNSLTDVNSWNTYSIRHGAKSFAYTDSNVASATKLANTRTIWGQNFDGTGNVDGKMVVNYAASNGVAIINANLSSSTNNYAYGLNITNSNQNTGIYTVGYLFGVNNSTNNQATGLFYYDGANSAFNRYGLGFFANDNLLNIRADGNVGIGTVSPNYKLDVKGTLRATGTAEFSDTLRAYGTINAFKNTPAGTWYNDLGIQVYSNDGSPVGIGFHRSGYTQAILEHNGDGLTIRNSGTIGAGQLGNLTANAVTASIFNGNLNGNASTATRIAATVSGTNTIELVRGNMADNDFFRILVGDTASNSGYVEIATADDGTEPIYIRQYSGVFTSLVRTAALLDEAGNTSFPGTVTASRFACSANNLMAMKDGYLAFQTYAGGITVGCTIESTIYINNSAALGITPTTWHWKAGSSSSWANFYIGSLNTYGSISASSTITTASYVTSAQGYYKSGSSNDYVLLGGGSHKLISNFRLKSEKVLKMVFRGYFRWVGTNLYPTESDVVYSDFCTSYVIKRVGVGRYNITFTGLKTTSNIAQDTTLQIFGAGRNINSDDGNPCYASISNTSTNYFDVIVADDRSTNDSTSFTLYINQML